MTLKSTSDRNTIAILSTCVDDWGGSEELWSRTIPFLKDDYQRIIVFKDNHNLQHPALKNLLNQEVILKNIKPSFQPFKRVFRQTKFLLNRIKNRNYYQEPQHYLIENFRRELTKEKPKLVIVSQGINFDGLSYAYQCLLLNIPYIIVSQKAVDFYWPHEKDRSTMKMVFKKALACYFVSFHNLRLTEDQFGLRLKNSRVVFNPIKTRREIIPYPAIDNGFRLACIARLFLIDKGQDILIRIMAQNKWKNRPLTVSIIGSGPDLAAIQEMIDLYGLQNVKLIGFQQSVTNLWMHYHGLILPSRSEGLPLTIAEAMSVGRVSIVSNAGGNAEFIEEGVSGFIGEANQASIDDALERAWKRRYEWQELGRNAHKFVLEHIPPSPEKNFAELLKQLTNEKRATSISNHTYV